MSCKTAKLSSPNGVATGSTALATNPASYALDADPNTMWKAATANAGESLKIDLGTSQALKGVMFKYELAGAYGYKVETSSTGSLWALKKTGTSAATATNQDANLTGTTARYIRVTFTSLPAGRSAAISDVRVF